MFYKWILIGGGALLVITYIIAKKNRVSPVLLRELADRYSDGSDQIIRTEIERGELNFISGRLTFAYIPERNKISIKSEFYFQDRKGQWVKKMHEEQLSPRVLTKDAFSELKVQQTVMFEIDAPEQKTRTAAH